MLLSDVGIKMMMLRQTPRRGLMFLRHNQRQVDKRRRMFLFFSFIILQSLAFVDVFLQHYHYRTARRPGNANGRIQRRPFASPFTVPVTALVDTLLSPFGS